MRLEGTDIEGYLAHQHDMIILTAIEEAKQGAEDHVQEMQRRYPPILWLCSANYVADMLCLSSSQVGGQ